MSSIKDSSHNAAEHSQLPHEQEGAEDAARLNFRFPTDSHNDAEVSLDLKNVTADTDAEVMGSSFETLNVDTPRSHNSEPDSFFPLLGNASLSAAASSSSASYSKSASKKAKKSNATSVSVNIEMTELKASLFESSNGSHSNDSQQQSSSLIFHANGASLPTSSVSVRSSSGWRTNSAEDSLPESFRSVEVPPEGASFWQNLLAYTGPGLMISVGYMDPGNWATDLAAGARFGYQLLFFVLFASVLAVFLQHLSLKLGIATGRDLAQACHDAYSRRVVLLLWILAELAIAATDLAEVIGSAIALWLLFGIPKWAGVLITALDVLIVLALQGRSFRWLEMLVALLVFLIAAIFGYQLFASAPDPVAVLKGFLPSTEMLSNSSIVYYAIGIVGATVMPHNLYMHSSIVQTRAFPDSSRGRQVAIKFCTIDSCISLSFAFFINCAILILAAAAFHGTANEEISSLSDAYSLLSPSLGNSAASTLFAIGLLASGQNSTLTGTMAGQVVMEGFIQMKVRPWLRRLLTRLSVIVPAALVAVIKQDAFDGLLVLSQVVLSFQLAFAVIPLVHFTCSRAKMGEFVNGPFTAIVAVATAAIVVALNVYLVIEMALGR